MSRNKCLRPRSSLFGGASLSALLGLLALTVPLSEALPQQAPTGSIAGKVTDAQGTPLVGAQVFIEALGRGTIARGNGDYALEDLPAGTHTVQVRMIGYRTRTALVTVSAGARATQNFSLAVDPLSLEELVVTGTFTPRQKLESSVAISTLSPDQLEMADPRSTTEVLRYVPGFTRVESSGGEVNQNVSMRGIYGVEFVMFMEDGMAVFPTMHTFFMNADNLFRMDQNIERVEVVRGGNSALFGSNAPGAIINIINKTGGPEVGGALKATAGFPGGLGRYDFNLNGPFGEDWRFNIGGYYRYDGGVRDPGFPGIRGGQFKGNITRLLDNGYVRMSAKVIDDRNQFILPLPFKDPSDPEYVPGFSNYGAMNTAEGLDLRIPLPFDNGELELPLDDGLRTKAVWLTGDVRLDFPGGWTFQNTAQVMQNDQGWNAILPFDVIPADAWAQEQLDSVFIKDGLVDPASTYELLFTNHFDASGQKLSFNTPNGLIAPGGQWHVEKPMSAFHDQLRLTKTYEEHQFTVGSYFAYYTMDNRWFFTDILTDVRDNPRFVDMIIIEPDADTVEVTKNGFRKFLSNYANGSGHTTIASIFGSAELQATDRLRIDLAARYEYNNFVQTSENNATVDLDGDPTTLYDAEVWGNRTFRHFDFNFNEWAGSAGLNYRVNEQIAVYGQWSRGFKTPSLDEYLFPAVAQAALFKPRHTQLVEGGVKYAGVRFGAAVSGFWGQLKDISTQGSELDPAGNTVWVILTCEDSPGACDQRSWGAEVELSGTPTPGLNLLTNWTFLKAEFGQGADLGSWLAGVPPVIGNFAASYEVSGLRLTGDWHYVGRRWVVVDQNKLNAYSYVNLGASYKIPGQGITVSADLLNLNQSKGFEEGNPRLRQVGGLTSDLFLARPVLPRRVEFSVTYHF